MDGGGEGAGFRQEALLCFSPSMERCHHGSALKPQVKASGDDGGISCSPATGLWGVSVGLSRESE